MSHRDPHTEFYARDMLEVPRLLILNSGAVEKDLPEICKFFVENRKFWVGVGSDVPH